MHSIQQTLAHRAPPATRRVRWQPYNNLASVSSSSSSSRSPSLSDLSTPATSVSPPVPNPTPLCEIDRPKSAMLHASKSLETGPSKTKYASGLVDQAVKSLGEIWRPQDIPTVFLTTSKPTLGSEIATTCIKQSSDCMPSLATAFPAISMALSSSKPATSFGSNQNLVPIKGFVHEVLRRSRTSGSVLQTALCYLEAIRAKVPELVQKERSGESTKLEFDSESRICPATAAELALESQLSSIGYDSSILDEDVMDTVRMCDQDNNASTASSGLPSKQASAHPKQDPVLRENDTSSKYSESSSSSSSNSLPSPLLCPRRAFLASLILASKFMQDKCYSNRAWAKLSGLPAREISRCERALGEALDWRLWVGKAPVTSSPSPPSAPATRPVVRCQSESSLALGASSTCFVRDGPSETAPKVLATSASTGRPVRPLRRSSTLPAEAFSSKNSWKPDQLMSTPMNNSPYSSPVPQTPGLSYSPTSTDSSSSAGDRTIQMSFMDDTMSQEGCWDGLSPTLVGSVFEASSLSGGKFAPAPLLPGVHGAVLAAPMPKISFPQGQCLLESYPAQLDFAAFSNHLLSRSALENTYRATALTL